MRFCTNGRADPNWSFDARKCAHECTNWIRLDWPGGQIWSDFTLMFSHSSGYVYRKDWTRDRHTGVLVGEFRVITPASSYLWNYTRENTRPKCGYTCNIPVDRTTFSGAHFSQLQCENPITLAKLRDEPWCDNNNLAKRQCNKYSPVNSYGNFHMDTRNPGQISDTRDTG